jgi:hypothetical protein
MSAIGQPEPRASGLVESLRGFGYNLRSAVADLIDNSITAEGKFGPYDHHLRIFLRMEILPCGS